MNDGINSLEKETSEKISSKVEVRDSRGEKANVVQEKDFKARLEKDNVEEKLIQFEIFLGKYIKQKVSEGLEINLASGPVGNGEVVDGVLSVNLPSQKEIDAVQNDERAKPFLDVLTKAGTTYEEFSLTSASSTTMHESEHMIIDSRPGSQLEKDFKDNSEISNDEGGHTLSLLDEGITYAFQMENDSGNELFQKMEADKPQSEDNFTVATRKRLGEALRGKVKSYVDEGEQIDGGLLKFAGEEMKKLNIEKYVAVSKLERSLRGVECRTEQWNNFESREFNNPTEVLEKLAVEGYCFHGSSRKIDGDLLPQMATDTVKESGNREAVYMSINPLLAEFTGIYGGLEGITERENVCHMEINGGEVSYPGESRFAVNNPDLGVKEGYVYVFDRRTKGFEEINGEILSDKKIEPLMVIKIKREDFKPTVEKIVGEAEKESWERISNQVASKLHDAWRESRRIEGTNQFEPRMKMTNDEAWINNHGGNNQIDIANTRFEDLPKDWKLENYNSAKVAVSEIYKAEKDKIPLDDKFIESASRVQHIQWLNRNENWAPPEQKMAYDLLSEAEKEKDRVVVRTAIEVYRPSFK